MMKLFWCASLMVALLVGADGASSGQPSTKPAQLEAQVDAYLRPYLDLGGFNGSILIAKGGRVLLSKGYGMANYELNVPNAPQTKFHLGSVSKTFTAAAIMLLQEQGKLRSEEHTSELQSRQYLVCRLL